MAEKWKLLGAETVTKWRMADFSSLSLAARLKKASFS